MARYFKIIEIDSDSFIKVTGKDLDGCCQIKVGTSDAVYVAVDDYEEEIQVALEDFEDEVL